MSIAKTKRIKLFCGINVRGVLTNDHVSRKRKGLGTTVLTFNDAHKRPNPAHKQRTAIVTLETIVWLPVLAILLAAVIEMGLIMTGTMHVAAASRLGAKLAAETMGLSPATTIGTANDIKMSVDEYLQNAGYETISNGGVISAGVRLQHSVLGGDSDVSAGGTCPEFVPPDFPALPSGAVRVGVCVNVTEVSPNLLRTFGFDTTNVTIEMFTTYPYEL